LRFWNICQVFPTGEAHHIPLLPTLGEYG